MNAGMGMSNMENLVRTSDESFRVRAGLSQRGTRVLNTDFCDIKYSQRSASACFCAKQAPSSTPEVILLRFSAIGPLVGPAEPSDHRAPFIFL